MDNNKKELKDPSDIYLEILYNTLREDDFLDWLYDYANERAEAAYIEAYG